MRTGCRDPNTPERSPDPGHRFVLEGPFELAVPDIAGLRLQPPPSAGIGRADDLQHYGKIVTTTMHPRWETSPVIRS